MKQFKNEVIFVIGIALILVVALIYVYVFDGGPIIAAKELYSYSVEHSGLDFFFPIVLFFVDEYLTLFAIFWMFLISTLILFAYQRGRLSSIKIPKVALILSASISFLLIISLLQYNTEGFPLDFVETCSEQSSNAQPYDPNDTSNWMRELSKCLVVVHDKPYYINMSIFLVILILWFLFSRKSFSVSQDALRSSRGAEDRRR